jgi:hypothetical protein
VNRSANTHLRGWCNDPYGRHEHRWLTAGKPTALVGDGGVESQDPPPDGPFILEPVLLEDNAADGDEPPEGKRAGSSGCRAGGVGRDNRETALALRALLRIPVERSGIYEVPRFCRAALTLVGHVEAFFRTHEMASSAAF